MTKYLPGTALPCSSQPACSLASQRERMLDLHTVKRELEDFSDEYLTGSHTRKRIPNNDLMRMGKKSLNKNMQGFNFPLRAPGMGFIKKRKPGMEFVGKRSGMEKLLTKRTPGMEFVGKRTPGMEFVGKRTPGMEFVGKRSSLQQLFQYTLNLNIRMTYLVLSVDLCLRLKPL